MGDIDHLSFLLGELKQGIEQGNADRNHLFKLVGEVKDEVSTLRQELNSHIKDEAIIENRIKEAEEAIEGIEALKTKAIIILAGVSSTIGAGVAKLFGLPLQGAS